MKKITCCVVVSLLVILLVSCWKEIFYSGEAILNGTTVRYLVDVESQSLTVAAHGSVPETAIYVKMMTFQSDVLSETAIDSIVVLPYHCVFTDLKQGVNYSLFLENNGMNIGLGQFVL